MVTWQTKKLKDVVKIQSGFGFPKNLQGRPDQEFPFLKVSDMNLDGNEVKIIRSNNTVNLTDVKKQKYKTAPAGTVIFPKIGGAISTNKKRILTRDSIYDNNVMGLIPSSELEPQFLYLWMNGFDLNRWAVGATLPAITQSRVENTEIPVPPLKEQKRIVKTLDDVFEKVTKAKEAAEKNLQNSKELFESYLNSVFVNPGKDWEEKQLGEVCEVIGGGTPSKKVTKYYGGNIPWATVRDMKFEVIETTEHKITAEAVKNSSTNIIPGGNVVIATRVGLGKICLVANDTAINQDLRGIIPLSPEKLLVNYLFFWLKSIAHKIKAEGTGATVHGVKLPFVKSLLIPIPSPTKQKEIIKNLNTLSAETKKLEKIYEQKLADLEELKKSVLSKAFHGEL